MKQSKKLTRAHYTFLKSQKVKQEVIDKLRFYRLEGKDYIFVYEGELVRVEKGELVRI